MSAPALSVYLHRRGTTAAYTLQAHHRDSVRTSSLQWIRMEWIWCCRRLYRPSAECVIVVVIGTRPSRDALPKPLGTVHGVASVDDDAQAGQAFPKMGHSVARTEHKGISITRDQFVPLYIPFLVCSTMLASVLLCKLCSGTGKLTAVLGAAAALPQEPSAPDTTADLGDLAITNCTIGGVPFLEFSAACDPVCLDPIPMAVESCLRTFAGQSQIAVDAQCRGVCDVRGVMLR